MGRTGAGRTGRTRTQEVLRRDGLGFGRDWDGMSHRMGSGESEKLLKFSILKIVIRTGWTEMDRSNGMATWHGTERLDEAGW